MYTYVYILYMYNECIPYCKVYSTISSTFIRMHPSLAIAVHGSFVGLIAGLINHSWEPKVPPPKLPPARNKALIRPY